MARDPRKHAARPVDNQVRQGRMGAQTKSGPSGAGNTVNLGPNPCKGGAMGQPTRQEAMGRLDGCPECVTRNNAPHETRLDADGYLNAYRCHVCGHAWLTSWMAG